MNEMDNPWKYEDELFAAGTQIVCGVDEAGAGPLMGPVYAAAVILPPHTHITGQNDSKKLKEKQRDALYDVIATANSAAYRKYQRMCEQN